MSFDKLYLFLEKLQKNNNKEWMDANRKEYIEVRNFYINWLDSMNQEIASIDPDYFNTPGKKAINRINNNLMFHPNKPVYKDHFAAGLDQVNSEGDFYIEIGLSENFIGGGYWHPSATVLRSIREAIDYNGSEFRAIINKQSFKDVFGTMIKGNELKTSPRGFSIDHKHIDLLRRKTFAVGKKFTKKEVLNSGFNNQVLKTYKELLPFRRYLNQAVTV